MVTLPDKLTEPLRRQLGHADVRTTQIYTHVIERGGRGVKSPLGGVLAGVPSASV